VISKTKARFPRVLFLTKAALVSSDGFFKPNAMKYQMHCIRL
jgi:hypothetical protein